MESRSQAQWNCTKNPSDFFCFVYFSVFLSFIWIVSSAVNTEETMEDTEWTSSDHGQCMPVFSGSLVHVHWDGIGERLPNFELR